MTLFGKGFFIWQIPNTEGGNAAVIAEQAKAAGLSHVLLKIADATASYNVDKQTGVDLCPPVVAALRAKNIAVLGWHYVYGYDPLGEAEIAIRRCNDLGLDMYVIDAEGEYKQPGRAADARLFMTRLRQGLPNLPVALCSYRYPSYHPQLPWAEFLEKCDYNMPQVYWLQSHNAGEQLIRSVGEFEAMIPFRPIIPVGAAFRQGGWYAAASEVTDFLNTARSLNLNAANFWEWANCKNFVPDLWETIKAYPWPATGELDIAKRYINALNTHDPIAVVGLYGLSAVHVNARRTVRGVDAIRAWYSSLFTQVLPNAVFTLVSFSGTGGARYLTWTATSSAGQVLNGQDTLGIVNDRIVYHFTQFAVT